MLDSNSDELVPLTDVPKLLPKRKGAQRVHVCSIYRWTSRGLRGVVLESVQVGGRRCTTRTALARFFSALTSAGTQMQPPSRPAKRRRSISEAESKLKKFGV